LKTDKCSSTITDTQNYSKNDISKSVIFTKPISKTKNIRNFVVHNYIYFWK